MGAVLLAATTVRAQTTHNVQLNGLQFIPADITIQVGDTVHWVWVSGNHNVESGVVVAGAGVYDGNFRSGDPTLVAGTTFDVTFNQAFLTAHPMPGREYPYYCVVHAGVGMTGIIRVAEPVPTVSEWGLVAFALMLMIGGSVIALRRGRAELAASCTRG